MLWANCQGAGMHPILFARITALSAPGLEDCLGEPGNGGASATSESDLTIFMNWHVTLLVSRFQYPRDKPFLLTMVSYFKK